MLTVTVLWYSLCSLSIGFLINAAKFSLLESPEYIPEIIDVDLFRNGNEFEKNLIIDLFDKSLQKAGVMRLINHGISSKFIDNSYNSALDFFKQSMENKKKFGLVNPTKCGYKGPGELKASNISGLLDEELDNLDNRDCSDDIHDYYESYWFNLKKDIENNIYPIDGDDSYINTDLWNTSKDYIFEMQSLWKTINKLASLSLLCDNDKFNNMINNASLFYSIFILWYYPPNTDINRDNIRFGAHTDWLTFTFVKTDIEGLQINIDNIWYNVKNYNDDSILLFAGDAIKIMSNNYWNSIWHRVISNKNNIQRLTMAYFSGPDLDQLVKTLQCKKINQNSYYTQVTVAEYFLAKAQGYGGRYY